MHIGKVGRRIPAIEDVNVCKTVWKPGYHWIKITCDSSQRRCGTHMVANFNIFVQHLCYRNGSRVDESVIRSGGIWHLVWRITEC